jgi:hypothetical protein
VLLRRTGRYAPTNPVLYRSERPTKFDKFFVCSCRVIFAHQNLSKHKRRTPNSFARQTRPSTFDRQKLFMDQDQAKNDLPGLSEADQQKVADAAAEQTFSYSYSGSSLQRIGYTLSVSTFRIFFRIFPFPFRIKSHPLSICFFAGHRSE